MIAISINVLNAVVAGVMLASRRFGLSVQWKKHMRDFLKETLSVVMGLLLLGAVLAAAIAPLAWLSHEVSKDPTAVRKAWLKR